MIRRHGRCFVAAIVWIVGASLAQAGDLQQWAGCGYGPGYNSPAGCKRGCCLLGCRNGCNNGCNGCSNPGELNPFGWIRGCCETPGTWRLNVWDGYHGDACTYRWQYYGAMPEYAHAPINPALQPGGQSGTCANCGASNNLGGYPGNPPLGGSSAYQLPGNYPSPTGPELEPGVPAPAPQ